MSKAKFNAQEVAHALEAFLATTTPTTTSGLGHNGDITVYKESADGSSEEEASNTSPGDV
jgi:hypothetical protein